jgi:O-acetyl-ADP-ribose deacetylase (regulator of RNase III)/uncharacterized protein YwgA
MSITFKKGDMFSEPVEAIVNTVNCVGVMGKGVALEFKKRWPDNFKAYKKVCDAKELEPGRMFIFDTNMLFATDGPRFLVNFPTKKHWRSKSEISYIEDGLNALVNEIKVLGIKSIAMPPLGCGNGGLEWDDVKPLIVSKLENLDNVKVVVFPPLDAQDEPEFIHQKFPMTYERAVFLKALNDLESHFDGSFDRLSLQKIAYFLQAFGLKLNLEFSRNLHGPYSEALRKACIILEKNGMFKGFTTEERLTHVTPSGCAVANEYLGSDSASSDLLIEKLDKFIQGYESPYGLELLSSVHYLAQHENCASEDKIIEEMGSWNKNKRCLFSKDEIQLAYKRLQEDGLVQCA